MGERTAQYVSFKHILVETGKSRRTGSARRCDQFTEALFRKHEGKRIQTRSARAFSYVKRSQRRALPVRYIDCQPCR